MDIKVDEKNGKCVVFSLDGKLDLNASKPLKEMFDKYLDDKDSIVLDLDNVDFANSSGLGLLVSLLKTAKGKNKNLYLCALRPYIKELFDVTQLNRIFDIYDSLEDVLLRCEE